MPDNIIDVEASDITASDRLNFLRQLGNGYGTINYSTIRQLILEDPNAVAKPAASYKKYSKDQILGWLNNPVKNGTKLIDASVYLYSTVVLYQRIVSYLSSLPTYDYIITPAKLYDEEQMRNDMTTIRQAYYDAANMLEIMNLKQTLSNMMRTVIREGAFFGIELVEEDSYIMYQLPYDKCKVVSWIDGCPVFALDMSYFNQKEELIDSIGGEVKKAYERYRNDGKQKWATMNHESSVCILADETIQFVVPPLAGCFPDLYVIDEYKDLAQSKEVIELYKLLCMKIPSNDKGEIALDGAVVKRFYDHIAGQLPPQIGLATTPFPVDEVNFNRTTVDRDMTARAERDVFSTIGISQMVMSNEISAASALIKSIINDFTYVRSILNSMQRWLNKKLKQSSDKYKFKVVIPDVNTYTREEYAKEIIKSMQYGMPNKGLLCAVSYGYTPSDTVGVNFLETEVFKFHDAFIPPRSANTQVADEEGAPRSDGEISPEGERSRDVRS